MPSSRSNHDGFTNVVTLDEPQVKNLNFYRPAVTRKVLKEETLLEYRKRKKSEYSFTKAHF